MSLFRLFPVIIVFLCLTLAHAAPLPIRNFNSLSTIERRDKYVSLAERSLSNLAGRDVEGVSLFVRDVPSRSLDTAGEQTLVRRKVHVSEKVKKAFQKAGAAIKHGFEKVGAGIKTAAVKVGKFVKTTGAKIVKFGLKIAATAESVAAHIVKVIPGIGTGISNALKGASKLLDTASNKIHVSLGKKLDKGMQILDKIQNPVSGAAGKATAFIVRRDIDEDIDLFGRKDPADFDEGLFARFPYDFSDQSVK